MTNEKKFSIYEQTKPAMEEMLKVGFSAEQVATIANYCFEFALAIQHMRVELEDKNAECNI